MNIDKIMHYLYITSCNYLLSFLSIIPETKLLAKETITFRGEKMGIFGKLGGDKEIKLTPRAGLLLAAITMTAIDGDVDDDEVSIITRLNNGGQPEDFDKALKAWKLSSVEECISLAASSLNAEQQLVAMANLIDIAMADGVLAGSEKDLLEAYFNAFDVNESDVGKIVDVIAVKNNKDCF